MTEHLKSEWPRNYPWSMFNFSAFLDVRSPPELLLPKVFRIVLEFYIEYLHAQFINILICVSDTKVFLASSKMVPGALQPTTNPVTFKSSCTDLNNLLLRPPLRFRTKFFFFWTKSTHIKHYGTLYRLFS